MKDLQKTAVIISSLGRGSGCELRARYLKDALQRLGWKAELRVPHFRSLPWNLEVLLSFIPLAFSVFRKPPDLAVAIKPYPNAVFPLLIWQSLGSLCVADVDDYDGEYRGGVAGSLVRAAQAPAFFFIKNFSTHHPLIEKDLKKYGKTVWLHQGVDLNIFKVQKSSAAAAPPWIGFTAHLNVACGLKLLLEWLEPDLKNNKYKLKVIGGGPQEKYFHEIVIKMGLQRQVMFTGMVRPETIPGHLSDVVLCAAPYPPSKANLYRVPMKIGEYLALGKRVVSNELPGLGLLKPFLFLSPADGPSFRSALAQALRSKDQRWLKGKRYVRKYRDWNRTAQEFVSQLEFKS